MSSIGNMVKSAFGGESDAARSARHGMEREMSGLQDARGYLAGKEELPHSQSEFARGRLGELYGIQQEATTVGDLLGEITGGNKYLSRLRDRGQLTPIFEKLLAGEYGPDANVDDILAEVELTPNRVAQEGAQLQNKSLRDIIQKGLDGEYAQEDPADAQARVQQEILDQAMGSPLYNEMRGQGEEGILRHQAMTGGMRSGDTQGALADYNARYLLQNYNQQLAGLGSFIGQGSQYHLPIAELITGKGQAWGQGTVAKGQAQIGAEQQATDFFMNLAGGAMGGMGGMPSFGGSGGGMGGFGGGNPYGASISGGGGGTGLLGSGSKFTL